MVLFILDLEDVHKVSTPRILYELSCSTRSPLINLHIGLFILFYCRQRIQRWLWKMKIRENSMKDVLMR